MKRLLIFILLTISLNVLAQDGKYKITDNDYENNQIEMADEMRQNGKIYVVVAVILTIFAGIIFYLIRLDKKITVLEKDLVGEKHL